MTSRYHGIKISGSQLSFLTERAIWIVEQWKKSIRYRFLPACYHVKESLTCKFFRFFQFARRIFRYRNFATMAKGRDDF